jgi:DNA polymerase I
MGRLPFTAVWVPDFEYHQPDGGLPDPLCVVALELISGTRIARWLSVGEPAPYDTGPASLFVAHNAASEVGCHLALEWEPPAYVFDTYATYRALKNGFDMDRSASLLAACSRYGIPTISSAAKARGRDIAIQGRAHAERHKEELLHYCGTDVDANAELFKAMLPDVLSRDQGLSHALIFGEYMKAMLL